MNATIKLIPNYTYDDYVHWEGKWELIEGIPYAMSPAPVLEHQRITANINAEFRIALKKCRHCNVYEPIDYKIADDTILQPDVSVICGTPKKKFLDYPPALVIEVLSPSAASIDRMYKYHIYQQQGIKYYLIVDVDLKLIEVYELQDGEFQQRVKDKDFTYNFHFPENCKATINFAEIWQ